MVREYIKGKYVKFFDQVLDVLETFFKNNEAFSIVLVYDCSNIPLVYSFKYSRDDIGDLDRIIRNELSELGFNNILLTYQYNYRGRIKTNQEWFDNLDNPLIDSWDPVVGTGHFGGLIRDIGVETDSDNWYYVVGPKMLTHTQKYHSLVNRIREYGYYPPFNLIEAFSNFDDFEKHLFEKFGEVHPEYIEKINDRTRSKPKRNLAKGEVSVESWLKSMGYDAIPQYVFNDLKDSTLLRYDFGFKDNHGQLRLVEFDGPQHFNPVDFGFDAPAQAQEHFEKLQKHDDMKNQYASDHNIPLLRIRYDEDVDDTLYDWLEDDLEKEGERR